MIVDDLYTLMAEFPELSSSETFKKLLKQFGIPPKSYYTPAGISFFVCNHFGIDEKTLQSRNRRREIVYPRQVAIYVMHLNGYKNRDICKYFGFTNATVYHSICVVKDEITYDRHLAEDISEIQKTMDGFISKKP